MGLLHQAAGPANLQLVLQGVQKNPAAPRRGALMMMKRGVASPRKRKGYVNAHSNAAHLYVYVQLDIAPGTVLFIVIKGCGK